MVTKSPLKKVFQEAVKKHQNGELPQAEALYKQIVGQNPAHAASWYNLGTIFHQREDYNNAGAAYQKTLAAKPDHKQAYYRLGEMMIQHDKQDVAEKLFRKALEHFPDNTDFMSMLARVLNHHEDYKEEEALYQKAAKLDPDNPRSYLNLGATMLAQGKKQEAEGHYRKAIALNPAYGEVYWHLVALKRYDSLDNPDIMQMKDQLDNPDINEQDKANFCFALGKVHDNCGSYDEAFEYYSKANNIRFADAPFDIEKQKTVVNEAIATFTPEFFANFSHIVSDSEQPVFIVSMPRSGSSLIEQILASHPDVMGAGELNAMRDITHDMTNLPGVEGTFPTYAPTISEEILQAAAKRYTNFLTRGIDERTPRITDKMPYNYMLLGIIAMIFPNARIIHSLRNPLDTCLSCYFQNFSGGNEHTNDIVVLGQYYAEYQRMMEHWKQVLPVEMIEIEYEELLTEPEDKMKELIDFLGLSWNDACLDFHNNKRTVRTASAWQVRQPIYKSSMERWRHYEAHLKPLKEALGIK